LRGVLRIATKGVGLIELIFPAVQMPTAAFLGLLPIGWIGRWRWKVRRIEVIFAGNPYQREEGITPGVG